MSEAIVDLWNRWLGPGALAVMLVVALVLALVVVRHHGRMEQWRLARAERTRPLAAPWRTVVSFSVAAIAVFVFLQIAREVMLGATRSFDVPVALAVHRLDGPVMDVVMKAFSFMGSPFAVVPLALGVLGWAYRRRDYRAMFALLIVVTMTELLNVALKDTFERARPTLFEKVATIHSYSFPSGHSMAAIATYGMMGVVLTRIDRRHRRFFEIVAPAFIFVVGLSRVYLGVHWPTDVLAGFVAGGFLLLAGAITLDGLPVVKVQSPRAEC